MEDVPEWVKLIMQVQKEKERKENEKFKDMTYEEILKWVDQEAEKKLLKERERK